MSEKLRLVSGGKRPNDRTTDKNQVGKQHRELRKISNTLQNQRIRSIGPRRLCALLIAAMAALLVILVTQLLHDFFGFDLGHGIGWTIAAAAVFAATNYVVHKRSTLPRTYAELLDNQLSAYDPVDVAAYRAFQNQVRTRGLNEDAIHYWLAQEYHALSKLSGPTKRRKSFIDRKL